MILLHVHKNPLASREETRREDLLVVHNHCLAEGPEIRDLQAIREQTPKNSSVDGWWPLVAVA